MANYGVMALYTLGIGAVAAAGWPAEVAGYVPAVGTAVGCGRIALAAAVALAGLGAKIADAIYGKDVLAPSLLQFARWQVLTGLIELVPFAKCAFKINEYLKRDNKTSYKKNEYCLDLIIAPYLLSLGSSPQK